MVTFELARLFLLNIVRLEEFDPFGTSFIATAVVSLKLLMTFLCLLIYLGCLKISTKDYWMLQTLYRQHFNHLHNVYDTTIIKLGYDKLIVHSGETKLRFQDDLPASFFVNIPFQSPSSTTRRAE